MRLAAPGDQSPGYNVAPNEFGWFLSPIDGALHRMCRRVGEVNYSTGPALQPRTNPRPLSARERGSARSPGNR